MIKKFLAGLFTAAVLGVSANAAQIEIQFTGLDLKYDGVDLYDAGGVVGGLGATATADPLLGVSFLKDSVLVGTLTTDIFADILIKGVTGLSSSGGLVTSVGNANSFGFDLLTSLSGWGLALNLDKVQVFYTGSQIAIGGGALATSVAAQNLPFGLVIDPTDAITVSFSSANLSNVTTLAGVLTGFDASGTGNVKGAIVPEPSSLLLGAMGALGLIAARRSRRS